MREVFTIGHSNHSLETLVGLLRAFGVDRLVDVRTVPKSRKWPQFNTDALGASLPERGIEYEHMAALGGRRRAREDSENAGWRNRSFRGYADFAQTESFATALEELCERAARETVALMCAEALWWRCHRRLIADRLAVAGWSVRHITTAAKAEQHRLPEFAVVERGTVTYPGDP